MQNFLPQPRFGRFLAACQQNVPDAERLYLWNMRIAGAFHKPLHLIEIGLRNHIDGLLREAIGPDWLLQVAEWQGSARPKEFRDRDGNKDYVAEKASKEAERQGKSKSKSPTQDSLLSSLNFSIWQAILGGHYAADLWSRYLAQGFSGIGRLEFYEPLDAIVRLRNRIAHHEPIIFKRDSSEIKTPLEITAPLLWYLKRAVPLHQLYANLPLFCDELDKALEEGATFPFRNKQEVHSGRVTSMFKAKEFGFVTLHEKEADRAFFHKKVISREVWELLEVNMDVQITLETGQLGKAAKFSVKSIERIAPLPGATNVQHPQVSS